MPNDNSNITFKYGTQSAYDDLANKDENTIYFITDSRKIYVGNDEYTEDAQMNDNIKQYVDSHINNVDVRIDNIIAHNNDTEGNTELTDIRTGVDGTNYESAGAAVRNQISDIVTNALMITDIENTITDLNDIDKQGIYFIGGKANFSNSPIQGIAFLLINTENSTQHYQIAIEYSNSKIYHRTKKNTLWSEWKSISDSDDVTSAINTALAKCYKNIDGTITDFNDINTTGFRYFSTASSIQNSPSGRGFLLNFFGTSNNISQIFMSGNGHVYSRAKMNGVWNSWGMNMTNNDVKFIPTVITQNDDVDTITDVVPFFVSSSYEDNGKLPYSNGGLLLNFAYPGSESTRSYQMFLSYSGNKLWIRNKISGIYTSWNEITATPTVRTNSIVKDSENQYTIYFGDYNIKLVRVDNDTTNAHLWNIVDIRKGESVLVPSGTDIIGPLKESGENDFMGGVHGDETSTLFAVYCDGTKYDMDSTVQFDTLDILMVSNLQRVSTKENIAQRTVHISIKDNEIEIQNQIKALTNFTVQRATNGGLIAARNDIITGVYTNNYAIDEAPSTSPSGIASQNNTTAVILTTIGKITVENIVGHERSTYKGYVAVFTTETPMRTKIYFDTISTSTPIQTNEVITGAFRYIFN